MTDLAGLLFDDSKVSEGIWVPWEGDIELKLAPMNNKRMEEFMRRKTNEKSRGGRARRLSEEETEAITNEAVARYVLIGWKNIQIDGKDFPYTWENALTLLTNPRLPTFYRFVLLSASDDAHFRVELEEESLGK